jgi:GGDEF domain-containing protein
VLLLEATPEQAEARACDLRAAIAEVRVSAQDGDARTTASIGVVAIDGAGNPAVSELLGRADAAMYRAERAGGDAVAAAGRSLVALVG